MSELENFTEKENQLVEFLEKTRQDLQDFKDQQLIGLVINKEIFSDLITKLLGLDGFKITRFSKDSSSVDFVFEKK